MTVVKPPPAAAAPVTRPAPNRWWILPAVLVGLVIVAWLVLAGLPFGGERRDTPRPQPRAVETVKEAPPPQASATIVDVPASTPPSVATAPMPTPVRKTPAPVIATPAPKPAPNPAAKPPAAATTPVPSERREIAAAEAESTLRSYVASYYRKSTECIRVDNRGYENVGYTLEVWDRCDASGGSRLLGRWRVDAKTRDVYRQREDGRYVRP